MVFAILATLIPSLGLGLLSFRQNEAQIDANVTRELRALTRYASREIEFWMDKHVHEVRVSATSGTVIDGLSTIDRPQTRTRGSAPGKNPQALAHYLRSVREKLDTILELTVVNAAGKTVASSAATPPAITLPSDWPQESLTDGLVEATPHWNQQ
ncbi:MAG: PDC sensor domain-containing protein, partial [Nitrosospira sp.]|nr:PDC sensor domain-containing protein [Nitrosospira sp.]